MKKQIPITNSIAQSDLVLQREVNHKNVSFPVLDTSAAGNSSSTIFLSQTLFDGQEIFIVSDAPRFIDSIRQEEEGRVRHTINWDDKFTNYLTYSYSDGSLIFLSSIDWRIQYEQVADRINEEPSRRFKITSMTTAQKPVTYNGTVPSSVKLIGPTANLILNSSTPISEEDDDE